jgi:ketosteroid isomerase-like protein
MPADGYILPPNAQPVQGREAIAEWQRRTRAEASYTVQPEGIRVDEIRFLAPDWVVHRGTLWGQRVPKAGGQPVPFETKYFDVLQRSDGGEWKVVYRMWSDSR